MWREVIGWRSEETHEIPVFRPVLKPRPLKYEVDTLTTQEGRTSIRLLAKLIFIFYVFRDNYIFLQKPEFGDRLSFFIHVLFVLSSVKYKNKSEFREKWKLKIILHGHVYQRGSGNACSDCTVLPVTIFTRRTSWVTVYRKVTW